MVWLVFEDKDWYFLTNQLMGCVKEIVIRKKDKEIHMCGGQLSLVPYLSLEWKEG